MVMSMTVRASDSRGLPCEPVRVGEGPGVAANREPVRSGAVGRDASVLGEGTVPVERQLNGTGRSGELDVRGSTLTAASPWRRALVASSAGDGARRAPP